VSIIATFQTNLDMVIQTYQLMVLMTTVVTGLPLVFVLRQRQLQL